MASKLTIALRSLRLWIAISLIAAVGTWTWFEADFEAKFTEGEPSPASISIHSELDAEELQTEIEVDGTLSLLHWANVRDNSAEVPEEDDDTKSAARRDSFDTMSIEDTRELISTSVWILIGFEAAALLAVFQPKKWIGATLSVCGTLMLMVLIVLILVLAPLSLLGGFEQDAREDDRGSSLVHTDFEGELDYGWNHISFYFEADGYDLGLVPAENRTAVIETEPGTQDPSYIGLEGEFTIPMSTLIEEMVLVLVFIHITAGISVMWLNAGGIETPRLLYNSEEE